MILLSTRGQQLTVGSKIIVADTVNYIDVVINASGDWLRAQHIFAHFVQGEDEAVVEANNGRCSVRLSAGEWSIWLHGETIVDGQISFRVTSTVERIKVQQSGMQGGDPFPPVFPTFGELIVEKVDKAIAAAEAAEHSAGVAEQAAINSAANAEQAAESADAAAGSATDAAGRAAAALQAAQAAEQSASDAEDAAGAAQGAAAQAARQASDAAYEAGRAADSAEAARQAAAAAQGNAQAAQTSAGTAATRAAEAATSAATSATAAGKAADDARAAQTAASQSATSAQGAATSAQAAQQSAQTAQSEASKAQAAAAAAKDDADRAAAQAQTAGSKATEAAASAAAAVTSAAQAVEAVGSFSGEINTINNRIDHIDEVIIETVEPLQKQADNTERSLEALWKLNKGQTYDIEQRNESGINGAPSGAKFMSVEEVHGKSEQDNYHMGLAIDAGTVIGTAEAPIRELEVYGKTEQESTNGYQLIVPSHEVGYIYSTNGITIEWVEDGGYKINGTASKQTDIQISEITIPAGTYTELFRGWASGLSLQNRIGTVAGEEFFRGALTSTVRQATTDTNVHLVIRIRIAADTSLDNVIVYPMLVNGAYTTDGFPAHEPYTGGIPSPNPDYPQEIVSVDSFTVKITDGNGAVTEQRTITPPHPLNKLGEDTDVCDVEKGVWRKAINTIVTNASNFDKIVVEMKNDPTLYTVYQTTNWRRKFKVDSCRCSDLVYRGPMNISQAPVLEHGEFSLFYSASPAAFSGGLAYYLRDEMHTTVASLTEYLKSIDRIFVYPLETPIETPIDPDDLAFLRSLKTCAGTTNVSITDQLGRDISSQFRFLRDGDYQENDVIAPTPLYPSEIKSVDSFEVKVQGKNLFNAETITANKWFDDATGKEANSNGYNLSDYIPVTAGTRYYFKPTGSSRNMLYDADKNSIITSWIVGSTSDKWTAPANCAYIRLCITTANLNEYWFANEPMTEYEPYTETIRTITPPHPLNKIGEYVDVCNVENGVWNYKVGAQRWDGNTSFSVWSAVAGCLQKTIVDGLFPTPAYTDVVNTIRSEIFKSIQRKQAADKSAIGLCVVNGATKQIAFWAGPNMETVAAFRAYLAEHPCVVQYPLESPTAEPIDPDDLAFLRSLELLPTDKHITVTDNHGRDVSYLLEYITKLDEVN